MLVYFLFLHDLDGLEFYGPVNIIKVMLSCSVYITSLFLDRLSLLSD